MEHHQQRQGCGKSVQAEWKWGTCVWEEVVENERIDSATIIWSMKSLEDYAYSVYELTSEMKATLSPLIYTWSANGEPN